MSLFLTPSSYRSLTARPRPGALAQPGIDLPTHAQYPDTGPPPSIALEHAQLSGHLRHCPRKGAATSHLIRAWTAAGQFLSRHVVTCSALAAGLVGLAAAWL